MSVEGFLEECKDRISLEGDPTLADMSMYATVVLNILVNMLFEIMGDGKSQLFFTTFMSIVELEATERGINIGLCRSYLALLEQKYRDEHPDGFKEKT